MILQIAMVTIAAFMVGRSYVRSRNKNKKTKTKLEIERRFLLKRAPHIQYDDEYSISQYYCANNVRVRETRRGAVTGSYLPFYIKTIKKNISHGVNQEDECAITKEEFDRFLNTATSKIDKTRLIKNVGDLKWEIDIFSNINVIIAEVELNDIMQEVEIPQFIQDCMILEITGIKEYSNKGLSDPYSNKPVSVYQ